MHHHSQNPAKMQRRAAASESALLGPFAMTPPATRIFINGYGTAGCAGGKTDVVVGDHYLFFRPS